MLVVAITRGLGVGPAGVSFEAVALFTILSNWAQLGADAGCVGEIARLRALGRIADATRSVAVALAPVLAIGTLAAVVVYACAPAIATVFFDPLHRDAGARDIRFIASRGFGTMKPGTSSFRTSPCRQPASFSYSPPWQRGSGRVRSR